MSRPYRSFGAFVSVVEAQGQVVVRAERGTLELRPIGAGIFRLRAARRKRLPAYRSRALAEGALANTPAWKLAKSEGGAQLALEGLQAEAAPDSGTLAFSWPGGKVFLGDLEAGWDGEGLVLRGGLAEGEHVYGLGEKTGWLDKRHRRYQMRNTDVLLERPEGIGIAGDPLYASFPVFLVHSRAGSYGVFVDNPEFTAFDFGRADGAWQVHVPAEALNAYILAGPTLPDVLRQYTSLTGRMPLPALWTLGYHQCRWGYKSEAEFRQVADELRQRRLPADALWFDIDYMDGYRVFTWDKKRFARPAHLLADLKAMGLRGVTIVDPGVKVDEAYDVYQAGQAGGHFVGHSDGREFHASVWPGRSAFPDFHRPETRAWWAGLVGAWMERHGLAGVWNDMNEPAGMDMSGPIADARHDGGRLAHAEARNTYGLEMARATYDGLLAQAPDARPFILTRAAYSGAQAVTALWGGDNSTHWEHLAGSLPMLMNLGLSGMPFVGVDIGGFAGDTHGELLARWFQAGAFYPFSRNHAVAGSNAHEPWAFGPEVEDICRRYIELRYQLLPYSYGLFREAAQTGAPIMRPLVWHYPDDPATYNLSDQFLFGPDLLVAPVTAPGITARAVYLPRGRWYRWGQRQPLKGGGYVLADAPLSELPLFVRGGAMVPMWPTAQHTGAVQRDALRLHLWPGRGNLEFYEDDGETRAYERGATRMTRFTMQAGARGVTLRWGPGAGAYTSPRQGWTFVFHDAPGKQALLDGKATAARRQGDTLIVEGPDDSARHTLRLA